jgi:N-acetylmuramoyl-L-alanine amidase
MGRQVGADADLLHQQEEGEDQARVGDPSPPTAPTPAPVQTPVQTPTPVTPSPAPKQSTPTPTSSGGKSVPTASHGEPRFALVEDVSTKDHQVIIQLNKFIPWTSFVVDNPDRIVIDLPEAFLGETLRKVVKSTIPAVQQVRIGQNSYDPALAKVVIDLHKKSPYQIFDDPEKKQITVDFSVQPSEAANTPTQSTTADLTPIPVDQPFVEAKSGGKYVVVIDAGHGGTDTGAISPYRKQAYEKDFNLTVSLKVQKMLAGHPSIKVHLTRTDDTFITLIDRVNFANQLNADAFVSIHANAFKDRPTIRGTETFYSRQDSITLSTIMHRQMLVATGFPDRLLKKADYRVIKSTKMPAVLLESGFISNPVEEKQIFDPLFQDRVAQAVVNGLKEYFSLNN